MLSRTTLIGALLVVGAVAAASWFALSHRKSRPALPVAAAPPRPAIVAEWPEMDYLAAKAGPPPARVIPATMPSFWLKMKLRNVPAGMKPKSSLYIHFHPLAGSADDKQRWTYGGAILNLQDNESGVFSYEGVANVCTNRESRMRASFQLNKELPAVELVLDVEPLKRG